MRFFNPTIPKLKTHFILFLVFEAAIYANKDVYIS